LDLLWLTCAMRAVADLTAAASTSPAPESSSPVLATSACYPRALGSTVTTTTGQHAPATQRGRARARPLFHWHPRPVRANDFPCFYVWILVRKGPVWPFRETFHTSMYGYFSQGPAQAPRPRLSIHLCMDSSATALACGERHLAVSAWVVSPVCPHPALYARTRIGYNPD
jgi:hypothetical protein